MAVALPDEDFRAIIRLVCPHCGAGSVATRRADTGEWVHNSSVAVGGGRQFSHTLCWANGLRNSVYAGRDRE